MTKQFTVDENHQGVYAYIKYNNEYIGKRCGKNNIYYICELLNEQDRQIKELEKKITKIEEIIDNRLDKNVRPKWHGNNELFIEEKVGYYYALKQLKKKLIREKICFNDINIEDME